LIPRVIEAHDFELATPRLKSIVTSALPPILKHAIKNNDFKNKKNKKLTMILPSILKSFCSKSQI